MGEKQVILPLQLPTDSYDNTGCHDVVSVVKYFRLYACLCIYVFVYGYVSAATAVKIAHAIKAITSFVWEAKASGAHAARLQTVACCFSFAVAKNCESIITKRCFRVLFLADMRTYVCMYISHSIISHKKDKCGLV